MTSIYEALERALEGANQPEASAAALALARRYAQLLDEPAVAGKYRIPLEHMRKVFAHYAATVRMTPTEARGLEQAEHVIATALGEHSVASDLGPKLLQALTALNMTLPVTKAGDPGQAKETESVKPAHPLAAERAARAQLRAINGGRADGA